MDLVTSSPDFHTNMMSVMISMIDFGYRTLQTHPMIGNDATKWATWALNATRLFGDWNGCQMKQFLSLDGKYKLMMMDHGVRILTSAHSDIPSISFERLLSAIRMWWKEYFSILEEEDQHGTRHIVNEVTQTRFLETMKEVMSNQAQSIGLANASTFVEPFFLFARNQALMPEDVIATCDMVLSSQEMSTEAKQELMCSFRGIMALSGVSVEDFLEFHAKLGVSESTNEENPCINEFVLSDLRGLLSCRRLGNHSKIEACLSVCETPPHPYEINDVVLTLSRNLNLLLSTFADEINAWEKDGFSLNSSQDIQCLFSIFHVLLPEGFLNELYHEDKLKVCGMYLHAMEDVSTGSSRWIIRSRMASDLRFFFLDHNLDKKELLQSMDAWLFHLVFSRLDDLPPEETSAEERFVFSLVDSMLRVNEADTFMVVHRLILSRVHAPEMQRILGSCGAGADHTVFCRFARDVCKRLVFSSTTDLSDDEMRTVYRKIFLSMISSIPIAEWTDIMIPEMFKFVSPHTLKAIDGEIQREVCYDFLGRIVLEKDEEYLRSEFSRMYLESCGRSSDSVTGAEIMKDLMPLVLKSGSSLVMRSQTSSSGDDLDHQELYMSFFIFCMGFMSHTQKPDVLLKFAPKFFTDRWLDLISQQNETLLDLDFDNEIRIEESPHAEEVVTSAGGVHPHSVQSIEKDILASFSMSMDVDGYTNKLENAIISVEISQQTLFIKCIKHFVDAVSLQEDGWKKIFEDLVNICGHSDVSLYGRSILLASLMRNSKLDHFSSPKCIALLLKICWEISQSEISKKGILPLCSWFLRQLSHIPNVRDVIKDHPEAPHFIPFIANHIIRWCPNVIRLKMKQNIALFKSFVDISGGCDEYIDKRLIMKMLRRSASDDSDWVWLCGLQLLGLLLSSGFHLRGLGMEGGSVEIIQEISKKLPYPKVSETAAEVIGLCLHASFDETASDEECERVMMETLMKIEHCGLSSLKILQVLRGIGRHYPPFFKLVVPRRVSSFLLSSGSTLNVVLDMFTRSSKVVDGVYLALMEALPTLVARNDFTVWVQIVQFLQECAPSLSVEEAQHLIRHTISILWKTFSSHETIELRRQLFEIILAVCDQWKVLAKESSKYIVFGLTERDPKARDLSLKFVRENIVPHGRSMLSNMLDPSLYDMLEGSRWIAACSTLVIDEVFHVDSGAMSKTFLNEKQHRATSVPGNTCQELNLTRIEHRDVPITAKSFDVANIDTVMALQSTLFDVDATSSKSNARSSSSRASDMRSRRIQAARMSHRRRRFQSKARRVEAMRAHGKSEMPDFSMNIGQLFQLVHAICMCDIRVATEVVVSFFGSFPYSMSEQIMSNISKILSMKDGNSVASILADVMCKFSVCYVKPMVLYTMGLKGKVPQSLSILALESGMNVDDRSAILLAGLYESLDENGIADGIRSSLDLPGVVVSARKMELEGKYRDALELYRKEKSDECEEGKRRCLAYLGEWESIAKLGPTSPTDSLYLFAATESESSCIFSKRPEHPDLDFGEAWMLRMMHDKSVHLVDVNFEMSSFSASCVKRWQETSQLDDIERRKVLRKILFVKNLEAISRLTDASFHQSKDAVLRDSLEEVKKIIGIWGNMGHISKDIPYHKERSGMESMIVRYCTAVDIEPRELQLVCVSQSAKIARKCHNSEVHETLLKSLLSDAEFTRDVPLQLRTGFMHEFLMMAWSRKDDGNDVEKAKKILKRMKKVYQIAEECDVEEDVHDIMVLEAKTRIRLNEFDRVFQIDERLSSWSKGTMKDSVHLKMARYCFNASKTEHSIHLGKIAARHILQAMAMNSEAANFMFVPVVSFLSTTGMWQDESEKIQWFLDQIPTKEFMPWASHVLSHVSKFPLLRSVLNRLMEECPQSMSIKVLCQNSEEIEGLFSDSLT
eukprot:TRINITY_DN659_c2_g1_i6.p1 TRINITY_DN659_c2_g1~~TRINITY_DN659_c2_g1_i6.p1  ORF type:complete len:2093 (+),score=495.14 TRINITY_DN659_c2_g1_i6:567-6281(+)